MKEIGKSALTMGLEVLQDVVKGENIKTAGKDLKENCLAFLDDTAMIQKFWGAFVMAIEQIIAVCKQLQEIGLDDQNKMS